MYYLAKLETHINNDSLWGHPFNIVLRSEHLADITEDMKKRIRDGCPERSLKIFKDVPVELTMSIRTVVN